jgi:hypothetical protein
VNGLTKYDAAHVETENIGSYTLPAGMYENPSELVLQLQKMIPHVTFHLDNNKIKIALSRKVRRIALSGRMAQLLGFTQDHKPYILEKN